MHKVLLCLTFLSPRWVVIRLPIQPGYLTYSSNGMCHRTTTPGTDKIFPFTTVSKYSVCSYGLSCFPTNTNRKSFPQKYPPYLTYHLRILLQLRMCAALLSAANHPSSLHGYNSTVDLALTTNGVRSTTARQSENIPCFSNHANVLSYSTVLQHETHCVSPKTK
jgi:hypothetical protein